MTTENLSGPLTGLPPVINPMGIAGPLPFVPPAQWQAWVAGQAYQAGPPASGCIGPDGNGYVRTVSGAETVWTPANWMLFSLAGEQGAAELVADAAQASATQAAGFAAAANEAAQNAVAAAGTLEFFTLAAFLAAPAIPATVQYVHVWGVNGTPYMLGQYAYGTSDLTYKNEGATATGVAGEVLVQGIYWRPLYDIGDGFADAGQFVGVIGDASFNALTGAATGTDNGPGLQAALDFAQQNGLIGVRVPRGAYLYNGSLYMGYGQAYCSLHLLGAPTATGNGLGVTFYPQSVDRPAICVSGGRGTLVRGIYILGKNYHWAMTLFGSTAISSNPTAYIDPALIPAGSAPGGLQQHSPYCAICVDPQAGAAPADAYAAMPTPSWTGLASGGYNRAPSSQTWIDGCAFSGFPICVAISPNNSPNGDYAFVTNCNFSYFVYGIAGGNEEGRNVLIRDNNFGFGHTGITSSAIGDLAGRFDGPIDNNSSSTTYQLFDFNGMGETGNVNVRNWYCENTVRIGRFIGGGEFSGTVRFESCSFGFNESIHGTIPASYVETDGLVPIEFDQTAIQGTNRITNLAGFRDQLTTVKGGNFNCAAGAPGAASVSAAFAAAVNYSGGLMASNCSRVLGANYGSLATPAGDAVIDEAMNNAAHRMQMTHASKYFYDFVNGRRFDLALQPPALWDFTQTAFFPDGTPTWAEDIVTFNMAAVVFSPTGGNTPLMPFVGSIVRYAQYNTLFIVTAIALAGDGSGNYTVTMQQMNNMQVNPATGAFVSNLLTNFTMPGYCQLFNTNLVVPSTIYWGDFTEGSETVANVHRGDGYAGNLATFIEAGDIFLGNYIQDAGDPWPIAPLVAITGVTNGSPGSITLSQPALFTGRFPLLPVPAH